MRRLASWEGIRKTAVLSGALLLLPLLTIPSCDFLNTQPVNDATTPTDPGEGPPAEPDPQPEPQPDPEPDPQPEPQPDPQPSAALTRTPYIQMLTKTSVLIAYRTRQAMETQVDYGTTTAYGSTASGPATTRHAISLSGLAPGQRFHYRVRSGSDVLAQEDGYFFDTDAGVGDDAFSFFVTGDVGEPGGMQEVTAARILQTGPRAELGLICGDVVYPDGESSDYDQYLMQPWAALMRNVAVYPALGNHDWHVDPDQHFVEEWYLPNNEHYYSYDRGNAHFIALDTRDGDIYDRVAQVAWLRADLEAHRDAEWIFAYYHHPGYTCTYKGYERSVIENLHPLFDEYGVDVAFMGHAHTYERLYPIRDGEPLDQEQEPHYRNPEGTIYIVTGCGAKLNNSTTDDCALNAVAIDRTIMFTHVTVQGRKLTIRSIESETGVVRDTVTIDKSVP